MAKTISLPQLMSLAIRKFQQSDFSGAEEDCRRILRADPNNAAALQLLGTLLLKSGEVDQAIKLLRKGVSLKPDAPEAHNNLGNVLRESNRFADAAAAYRAAVRLRPKFAEAQYGLGAALFEMGRRDEAVASLREAVAIRPRFREAFNLLGAALEGLGNFEEAARCYRQSLSLHAGDPQVLNNLGSCLRKLGRADAAITCLRQALALRPDFVAGLINLAAALRDRGDQEGAMACYRKALLLDPDNAVVRCELAHGMRHVCDWGEMEASEARVLDMVRQGAAVGPFYLLAMPAAGPDDQLRCARQWAAKFTPSAPLVQSPRPTDGPIHIGYLSADLHQHATAFLMAEVFERHDRARFRVTAYSCGADDGSDMRRRLVAAFDDFVDAQGLSHRQAAERIDADGVHILVDLKGYTSFARTEILGYRPAPIQVNYLGYPGTMGAPFIDYIISDAVVSPMEHARFYSEKIVQLPDSYQPNDRQRAVAAATPSRAECGLPEHGFVFCSFNNSYKITPRMFDVWMRLLAAVPGAVLWLLERNEQAAANLRREAAARGIGPERLVFAPRLPLAEHLARHRLADLFLDTLPCNAHTTASDALWAGLPVLTCLGDTFAARVAGSLVAAVGLPELIVGSLEEYEEVALSLARDAGRLAAVKDRLDRNRLTAPLFDSGRFTRNLEAAYRGMWERWRAGKPPEAFAVTA